MHPRLLEYLCDPVDQSPLSLRDGTSDERGRILDGWLVAPSGRRYPVTDGIPRFADDPAATGTVQSFGDQWNHFNFDKFKSNWLSHTVANTWGTTDVFRGKVIVDAGAGSGMQSRWMAELGADHVIALELSHAVSGVARENLAAFDNVDVVQCSIDQPPLRDGCISGMVYCHNVIQHTRSVEGTARALFRVLAPGGELVFNCYPKDYTSLEEKARYHLRAAIRRVLQPAPFGARLAYSRAMSLLRFIPLFGGYLERSGAMQRGHVPPGPAYLTRSYLAGVLNTFDFFGGHAYQHYKLDAEIRTLVDELQPDRAKVLNTGSYFAKPRPIGCALRVVR